MACRCSHIEHHPIGCGCDEVGENLQAFAFGVYRAGSVGIAGRAELGLNFGFYVVGHRANLLLYDMLYCSVAVRDRQSDRSYRRLNFWLINICVGK